MFETGEICSYQIRGVGPNRTVAWYETQIGPVKRNGDIVAVTQISTDITDRKKAEKELRTKTAILQDVIATVPHCIFWKNKNSVYLGCNDNFAKLAGVKNPEDIIGKTDYDLSWKKEESDFYRKIDKEVMDLNEQGSDAECKWRNCRCSWYFHRYY